MGDIRDPVLNKLRMKIDKLDGRLWRILELRFTEVEKVGMRKKKKGLPFRDLTREEEMINANIAKTSLPEKFVEEILRTIIKHAIEMEEGRSEKEYWRY